MTADEICAGLRQLADLVELNKDQAVQGVAFIAPPEGAPIQFTSIGSSMTSEQFFGVLSKSIIASQDSASSNTPFIGTGMRR